MQEGKAYALRLDIRSVSAENLIAGRTYSIKISKDQLEKSISSIRVKRQGELIVGEKVEFKIPSNDLRRESKCTIRIIDDDEGRQCGKFEFLIMNYKNYSKNTFKLTEDDCNVGTINMTINISSLENNKNSQKRQQKYNEKILAIEKKKRVDPPPPLLMPPPSLSTPGSAHSIQPSIVVKPPIEEIRLICPSEVKEPKSMYSAFDASGIEILTKKEIDKNKRNTSDKKPLSSMGQLFEKKGIRETEEGGLKPPINESLVKSCRLSPSRLQKDSRYCKEIQQNLDSLSALDQETNRLTCSRSPLKSQEAEFSIFDTLHRMKDKFQKIHEHQGFLNDELPEINEEQTEEKDKLVLSDSNPGDLRRYNSAREPEYGNYGFDLVKSSVINLEVHSTLRPLVNTQQSNCHSQCEITKTLDVFLRPTRRPLRITSCFTFQHSPDTVNSQSFKDITLNKRYLLARIPNLSAFEPDRQIVESAKHVPTLSQSYLNFEIEEESLKRTSYIKLNKISHLSRAAEVSKRRNNFLIKANQQLKVAQRLAQQKLEISKKIISEKEDILNHQFQTLREHMRVISTNLSLKNEQSVKRQQKVKSLQGLVQQYARDINSLKEELKAKNTIIKDLKCLLALKEDADNKTVNKVQKTEDFAVSKTFKQVFEELLVSKNFKEAMQRDDPVIKGGGLLEEVFKGEKRSNSTNKTFQQERNIRKFSSIDNTVNNINLEDNIVDKSVDVTCKTFRKFSHSKNASFAVESQKSKTFGKPSNPMDLMFEKLTGLFSGNSSDGRILKNL